jgi:uncharacterized delta-60 repeat protein
VVYALQWDAQDLNDITFQSDGKIVVAGSTGAPNYRRNLTLTRYFSNGYIDSSFGMNGRIVSNPDSQLGDTRGFALAIQKLGPSGAEKIIAGGQNYVWSSFPNFFQVLMRYHPNGTQDMSFGTNGMIRVPGDCYRLRVQPDGKILVAGGTASGSVDLHRYLPDGAPDSAFGVNGYTSAAPGAIVSYATGLALMADGRIVVGGVTWVSGTSRGFTLVRYKPNGTKDSSFGLHGITKYYVGANAELKSVVVQPNGKVVAFGTADAGPGPNFVFLRYDSTGQRDNSFGNSGIVRATFQDFASWGKDMVVQPDGKLISVGYTQPVNGGYVRLFVARMQMSGAPDSTFGVYGKDTLHMGSIAEAHAARLLPNGKLLVGGHCLLCKDPAGIYSFNQLLLKYLTGLDLGILDMRQQYGYAVYPNPVNASATLSYELLQEETLSIALSDMNGSIVQGLASNMRRPPGKHKESLRLNSSLPPGYYLLTISSEKGKYSIRIIKD